jgi:hypothetical protein
MVFGFAKNCVRTSLHFVSWDSLRRGKPSPVGDAWRGVFHPSLDPSLSQEREIRLIGLAWAGKAILVDGLSGASSPFCAWVQRLQRSRVLVGSVTQCAPFDKLGATLGCGVERRWRWDGTGRGQSPICSEDFAKWGQTPGHPHRSAELTAEAPALSHGARVVCCGHHTARSPGRRVLVRLRLKRNYAARREPRPPV